MLRPVHLEKKIEDKHVFCANMHNELGVHAVAALLKRTQNKYDVFYCIIIAHRAIRIPAKAGTHTNAVI